MPLLIRLYKFSPISSGLSARGPIPHCRPTHRRNRKLPSWVYSNVWGRKKVKIGALGGRWIPGVVSVFGSNIERIGTRWINRHVNHEPRVPKSCVQNG